MSPFWPLTILTAQEFKSARKGESYTTPTDKTGILNQPGAKAGPFSASLSDGSVVTYAWYRFVDQPAIVALNGSDTKRNII